MDTAAPASPCPAVLDPENQFLGSVLCSSLDGARALMAGIRTGDFARPMAGHVAQLAMQVMADGHAPGPALLYSHAVTTGQARGEHRITWLARELADLYGHATGPVYGPVFKAAVIEGAYRRATIRHAHRLLHAADAGPAAIAARLDDTTELATLADRYRAAAGPHALTPPDIVQPAPATTTTAPRRRAA